MLPYDGTPIKDELACEGRLRGDINHPDYDFIDPRVTNLYATIREIVDVWGWIHGYRALSPELNWAWNEIAIMRRLFPKIPELRDYSDELRRITKASNDILFDVMDALVDHYAEGRSHHWTNQALDSYRQRFLKDLLEKRNGFVGRHQDTLMGALAAMAS
jgi:hypothetical protein